MPRSMGSAPPPPPLLHIVHATVCACTQQLWVPMLIAVAVLLSMPAKRVLTRPLVPTASARPRTGTATPWRCSSACQPSACWRSHSLAVLLSMSAISMLAQPLPGCAPQHDGHQHAGAATHWRCSSACRPSARWRSHSLAVLLSMSAISMLAQPLPGGAPQHDGHQHAGAATHWRCSSACRPSACWHSHSLAVLLSMSAISVPLPGPSSTKCSRGGRPSCVHVYTAHAPSICGRSACAAS